MVEHREPSRVVKSKTSRISRARDLLDERHESAYQSLVSKTSLYEKLKRGEIPDDLNTEDVLFLPDSSASVKKQSEMVEVIDEFGRSRMVSKTNYSGAISEDENDDGLVPRPARIIRGNHVQTGFKIDEEAAQRIREFKNDESNSSHFDPDWEVRSKGTGFYRFENKDSQVRKEQQDSLNKLHEETLQTSKNEGEDPLIVGLETFKEDTTSYERRVNERKKLVEKMREKQLQKMKDFVKGSDL